MSRDEGTYSAVEIEFADALTHNKLNITDHHNFTMASLCDSGAVFACKSSNGKLFAFFFVFTFFVFCFTLFCCTLCCSIVL